MKSFARFILVLGVAWSVPALADDPVVKPTALVQADLLGHPQAEEGENGFSLARARLGVWSQPTDKTFGVVSAEFMRPEHPEILDAFVRGTLANLTLAVGYMRSPLFVSARSELEGTMPLPELSMPVRAAWPGRDVAIEAYYLFEKTPFEAWLRVGNGSPSPFQNDSGGFAVTARLDSSFGRAAPYARGTEMFGGRLGVGVVSDDSFDRAGLAGTTASGFQFFRPPVVSGQRTIAEFHALLYSGPVRTLFEAVTSSEERMADADGNPATPRLLLDPARSRGAALEVAWSISGAKRALASWPYTLNSVHFPEFELAARVERLDLARGSRDLAKGGGSGASVAINTWINSFAAFTLAYSRYSYDTAPIEEPGRLSSWIVQARTTFILNPAPSRDLPH